MAAVAAAALNSSTVVLDAAWKFSPPALLTVKQAAWYILRRDDTTGQKQIRRMMDRGLLQFVTEGKRKWIPWSEVQRFMSKEVSDGDIL